MTPVRRTAWALAVCGWLLLTAAPARAHADLVSSDPPAGATLDAPPAQVTLTFTERLDASGSDLEIVSSGAGRVPADVSAAGRSLTARPRARLEDGLYSVRWRAATPDGHVTSGALSFSVQAPPTQGPASPSVSAGPTASARPGGGRGATTTTVVLLILGAAASGLALLTHRSAAWVIAGGLVIGAAATWLSGARDAAPEPVFEPAGAGIAAAEALSDPGRFLVRLEATPGTPGPNALTVRISRPDGTPVEADAVSLLLRHVGRSGVVRTVELTERPGRWDGQGQIDQPGTWDAMVTARIGSDQVDARLALITRSGGSPEPSPGSPFVTSSFPSGVALAVVLGDDGRVSLTATAPDGSRLPLSETIVVGIPTGGVPTLLAMEPAGRGAARTTEPLPVGRWTVDVVVRRRDGRAFQATLLDVPVPT